MFDSLVISSAGSKLDRLVYIDFILAEACSEVASEGSRSQVAGRYCLLSWTRYQIIISFN
jgi:hypothetical protein